MAMAVSPLVTDPLIAYVCHWSMLSHSCSHQLGSCSLAPLTHLHALFSHLSATHSLQQEPAAAVASAVASGEAVHETVEVEDGEDEAAASAQVRATKSLCHAQVWLRRSILPFSVISHDRLSVVFAPCKQ